MPSFHAPLEWVRWWHPYVSPQVNKNILMSVSPPAGGAAFLPTTKVGGISPRSGEVLFSVLYYEHMSYSEWFGNAIYTWNSSTSSGPLSKTPDWTICLLPIRNR